MDNLFDPNDIFGHRALPETPAEIEQEIEMCRRYAVYLQTVVESARRRLAQLQQLAVAEMRL